MAENDLRGAGSAAANEQFCRRAFEAAPMARIHWVKDGVNAEDAQGLLQRLTNPHPHRLVALERLRAAAIRRAQRGGKMPRAQSECVLGIAALIGQVQALVADAGTPEGFEAALWFRDWLAEPLPALGGVPPGDLIDAFEGRQLVSSILGQIGSGVFA